MIFDFGNGFQAATSKEDGIPNGITGHSGLEVPDVDLALLENAVSDGGRVQGSRAKMRRMTFRIIHDGTLTRRQIAAAFTPGVSRILTTERASLPYQVEALSFPDRLLRREFSVTLISSEAYPLGPLLEESADNNFAYTTTTYAPSPNAVYNPPLIDGLHEGAQTFVLPALQRLTSCGILAYRYNNSATVRILRTSDGVPTYTNPYYQQSGVSNTGGYYTVNHVIEPAEQDRVIAVTVATTGGGVDLYRNNGGTAFADGAPFYRSSSSAFTALAVNNDFSFRRTVGTTASATTKVFLDPQSDLPTPPRITITLGANASSLTITDGTRTATITGTMTAGQVVVLDCANYTVTVNGTNRIAWFDRNGDWPLLDPNTGYIETSVAGEIDVTWQPRYMGLL